MSEALAKFYRNLVDAYPHSASIDKLRAMADKYADAPRIAPVPEPTIVIQLSHEDLFYPDGSVRPCSCNMPSCFYCGPHVPPAIPVPASSRAHALRVVDVNGHEWVNLGDACARCKITRQKLKNRGGGDCVAAGLRNPPAKAPAEPAQRHAPLPASALAQPDRGPLLGTWR